MLLTPAVLEPNPFAAQTAQAPAQRSATPATTQLPPSLAPPPNLLPPAPGEPQALSPSGALPLLPRLPLSSIPLLVRRSSCAAALDWRDASALPAPEPEEVRSARRGLVRPMGEVGPSVQGELREQEVSRGREGGAVRRQGQGHRESQAPGEPCGSVGIAPPLSEVVQ